MGYKLVNSILAQVKAPAFTPGPQKSPSFCEACEGCPVASALPPGARQAESKSLDYHCDGTNTGGSDEPRPTGRWKPKDLGSASLALQLNFDFGRDRRDATICHLFLDDVVGQLV